jgi:hypothetical protein
MSPLPESVAAASTRATHCLGLLVGVVNASRPGVIRKVATAIAPKVAPSVMSPVKAALTYGETFH